MSVGGGGCELGWISFIELSYEVFVHHLISFNFVRYVGNCVCVCFFFFLVL